MVCRIEKNNHHHHWNTKPNARLIFSLENRDEDLFPLPRRVRSEFLCISSPGMNSQEASPIAIVERCKLHLDQHRSIASEGVYKALCLIETSAHSWFEASELHRSWRGIPCHAWFYFCSTMIFVFWMLRFKPVFSLSSFIFIKRLFSSSSLSAIRVVSSAYLKLLIFPPAILSPACASSSPAFHMMSSA